MNGIICVNKQGGWTSFDVVAKMRGIAKTRKIGHAGTLDPMATGVLPLFFGAATKLCDMLPDEKKGYRAEFRLGMTTDTLDRTGITLTVQQSQVTLAQLQAVLPQFTGDILQFPPMYSAVQIDGKRLYDLARQGKEVARTARPVCINRLELVHFNEKSQSGTLLVECSKGTYIRSLVDDIGRALGCGAVLWQLQRYLAGQFVLSDCYRLVELDYHAKNGGLQSLLRPIDSALQEYPKITLSSAQVPMFCNGVKLDLNRVHHQPVAGYQRVYSHDQIFLGLARCDFEQEQLRLVKSFWQAEKR